MNNFEDKLNILNSSNFSINPKFKANLLKEISSLSQNKFSFMKINKLMFIPPVSVAVVIAAVTAFSSFNGTNISSTAMLERSDSPMMDTMPQETDSLSISEYAGNSKIGIASPSMPSFYYQDERVSTSKERYYNTDAYVALEAKDIEMVSDKVITIVKNSEGILDNYSINEDENRGNSYMTFKIPAKNLTDVTRQIKLLGYKVVAQNISTQDQTVQVEDTQGNTENTVEYYNRLITELNLALETADLNEKQKLAIENQIQEYKTIIGDMENQVDDLKNGLSYSTLTVSVERVQPFFTRLTSGDIGGGYIGDLMQSGSMAFVVLGLLLRFVGHVVIWALVFGIAWLPVWLIIRFVRNRRQVN
ncbi:MAG: DUF4349 domain-containing protein [bacterium]|nr:DUF4349 domain-containing protein [bacterium]